MRELLLLIIGLATTVTLSYEAHAKNFQVYPPTDPSVSGSSTVRFGHRKLASTEPSPAPSVNAMPLVPAILTHPSPQTDRRESVSYNQNYIFVPESSLQARVKFWIDVYTKYSTSQGVIHDSKYVDLIYEELDFQKYYDVSDFTMSPAQKERLAAKKIKEEKAYITKLLRAVHTKQHRPDLMTDEERKIYDKFRNIDEPNKYLAAAHRKRLRFQLGQKDRFIQGLHYSGRYLPIMERIFKNKGLPVDLTRLPFVESSFNLRARSKVGASGIWQFMRSTGKLYIKIDDVIDERNDPIRATEAAAEFLAQNYEALGHWPLAVTAYNHGRLGMWRATQKVGSTNLAEIIEHYKSSSFGFASSNFYAEFLAAVEVSKNPDKYFGKVEIEKPLEIAEFVMTDYIDFKDLSTYSRIPFDVLQDLNPGLTDLVYKSEKLVPAGYVLRIPADQRDSFLMRYNEIPGHRKFSSQKGPSKGYLASAQKNGRAAPKRSPGSMKR